MAERKCVMATTHRGNDNIKNSKEFLEIMAAKGNTLMAIPLHLDHDLSLPPLGKTGKMGVEPYPLEEGEYRLIGGIETFDQQVDITMPDGTTGVRLEGVSDLRPFRRNELQEAFKVCYDRTGFAAQQDIEVFSTSLQSVLGIVEVEPYTRRSFSPEHVLILAVTVPTWFVAKLVYKTAEKITDQLSDSISNDVVNLYETIRLASINYSKNRVNRKREVTYIFTLPGNPQIEFFAQVTDPSAGLSLLSDALTLGRLQPAVASAVEMKHLLDASTVQFTLKTNGGWEFNYLTTSTGLVVGTPASISRREERIELMEKLYGPIEKWGFSYGATGHPAGNDEPNCKNMRESKVALPDNNVLPQVVVRKLKEDRGREGDQ